MKKHKDKGSNMVKNSLFNNYSNNKLAILNVLLVGLNFSIGACYILKSPQKIEVIDMSKLLSDSAKQIAKKYPDGNVPQPLMQQNIEEIKNQIDEFGKQNNITILAKGAVLSSDFKDCTVSLINSLQEKE